jgi:hypothetical protein
MEEVVASSPTSSIHEAPVARSTSGYRVADDGHVHAAFGSDSDSGVQAQLSESRRSRGAPGAEGCA